MSPTSYRTAPPRDILFVWYLISIAQEEFSVKNYFSFPLAAKPGGRKGELPGSAGPFAAGLCTADECTKGSAQDHLTLAKATPVGIKDDFMPTLSQRIRQISGKFRFHMDFFSITCTWA